MYLLFYHISIFSITTYCDSKSFWLATLLLVSAPGVSIGLCGELSIKDCSSCRRRVELNKAVKLIKEYANEKLTNFCHTSQPNVTFCPFV